MNTFLTKPVTSSLLFDSVKKTLGEPVYSKFQILKHDFQKKLTVESIADAKILLVEDNSINQQVAKEILECEGLLVTVANNM